MDRLHMERVGGSRKQELFVGLIVLCQIGSSKVPRHRATSLHSSLAHSGVVHSRIQKLLRQGNLESTTHTAWL